MESPDAQDEQGKPTPKASRRRRIGRRWIAVVLILFVVVIVASVPALVSSPLGRPLLVGYVDEQLNGRLEIRDCSLGWFHGMSIDGLVVFDAENRQILQAARVTTGLKFADAFRGRYRLGKTTADGVDFLLSRDANGSLNWDRLVRSDSSWRSPEALNSLSGALSLSGGSCTYEDESGQPPVFLRAIALYVNVPEGDRLMADSLSANARIGNLTSGSIRLTGAIHVQVGGQTKVDQQLITSGLDPSIVSQRLGPAWRMVARSDGHATFETERGERVPATSGSQRAASDPFIGSAQR